MIKQLLLCCALISGSYAMEQQPQKQYQLPNSLSQILQEDLQTIGGNQQNLQPFSESVYGQLQKHQYIVVPHGKVWREYLFGKGFDKEQKEFRYALDPRMPLGSILLQIDKGSIQANDVMVFFDMDDTLYTGVKNKSYTQDQENVLGAQTINNQKQYSNLSLEYQNWPKGGRKWVIEPSNKTGQLGLFGKNHLFPNRNMMTVLNILDVAKVPWAVLTYRGDPMIDNVYSVVYGYNGIKDSLKKYGYSSYSRPFKDLNLHVYPPERTVDSIFTQPRPCGVIDNVISIGQVPTNHSNYAEIQEKAKNSNYDQNASFAWPKNKACAIKVALDAYFEKYHKYPKFVVMFDDFWHVHKRIIGSITNNGVYDTQKGTLKWDGSNYAMNVDLNPYSKKGVTFILVYNAASNVESGLQELKDNPRSIIQPYLNILNTASQQHPGVTIVDFQKHLNPQNNQLQFNQQYQQQQQMNDFAGLGDLINQTRIEMADNVGNKPAFSLDKENKKIPVGWRNASEQNISTQKTVIATGKKLVTFNENGINKDIIFYSQYQRMQGQPIYQNIIQAEWVDGGNKGQRYRYTLLAETQNTCYFIDGSSVTLPSENFDQGLPILTASKNNGSVLRQYKLNTLLGNIQTDNQITVIFRASVMDNSDPNAPNYLKIGFKKDNQGEWFFDSATIQQNATPFS